MLPTRVRDVDAAASRCVADAHAAFTCGAAPSNAMPQRHAYVTAYTGSSTGMRAARARS